MIHSNNNKKLFYAQVDLELELFNQLKTDFDALTIGKNPENIAIIIQILKEKPISFDLYDRADYLLNFKVNTVEVCVYLDPNILEKKYSWGKCYNIKPDFSTEIEEIEIESCTPLKADNKDIVLIAHSTNLYELSYNLVNTFDFTKLSTSCFEFYLPKNIPFLLTKCLEQFGKALQGNDTSDYMRFYNGELEPYGDIPRKAFSGFEASFLTLSVEIRKIVKFLTDYKQDLISVLNNPTITNQQDYLDCLNYLENVEKSMIFAFKNIAVSNQEIDWPSKLDSQLDQLKLSAKAMYFFDNNLPITDTSFDYDNQLKTVPQRDEITYYRFHGEIQEKSVNLELYPCLKKFYPTSSDYLVLGDLHGNAMKFIYFLLNEGIMQGINKADYIELVHIYNSHINTILDNYDYENLSRALEVIGTKLKRFIEIISLLVPCNNNSLPTFVLIGDVLADLGANDYYTLKIFEHLNTHGIFPIIVLSNHDREFLEVYEKDGFSNLLHYSWKNPVKNNLLDGQTNSLMQLCELIRFGLINKEEIKFLMEKVYIPLLTGIAINVSFEDRELTQCTHAPVSVCIIPDLDEQLEINTQNPAPPYTPKVEIEVLIESVKSINEKIKNLLKNKCLLENTKEETALYRLMWERVDPYHDDREFHMLPTEWKTIYVHGHHGKGYTSREIKSQIYIYDLDNRLGREEQEGNYSVYYYGNNKNYILERTLAFKRCNPVYNQSEDHFFAVKNTSSKNDKNQTHSTLSP